MNSFELKVVCWYTVLCTPCLINQCPEFKYACPFLRVWPFGVFDLRNGISFIMVTIPTKMRNVVMAKKKKREAIF